MRRNARTRRQEENLHLGTSLLILTLVLSGWWFDNWILLGIGVVLGYIYDPDSRTPSDGFYPTD